MVSLSIVIPCFNEQEILADTANKLADLVGRMVKAGTVDKKSSIYFVDDGSSDVTWEIICDFNHRQPELFKGIKLSRNQGHQRALLAGLLNVPGDAVVSIDADLQDDIEAIPEMVHRLKEGYDIVYGVRAARDSDTFFKRSTARLYYGILRLLGVEIVFDHADFRLLSRRAVDALGRYKEVNLFLRAVIPLLGFKTTQVFYNRKARMAGESKYPISKMLGLAINGITSFSMRPLRVITFIGFAIALLSFLVGAWAVFIAIFTDLAVPGWASIIVPNAFLGGIQMLSLGVIGEYIGKIFLEVKHRPLFEIEQII